MGRKAFDKTSGKKIAFEELVRLIDNECDYKFAIIDNEVDEELMKIAKENGFDVTGFKHVIETSGVGHSENRHGKKSNDRNPLSIEDYLLIPYIIKNRDSVILSPSKNKKHKNSIFIYEKKIGDKYVYVEEIREGRNKSLAFQSLRKRKTPQ